MEIQERGSMDTSLGISRRTLLRRGAVVGGLVWTAPVVHTLAAPAAAAGTPAVGDISFVAILVQCQDGLWYEMKWDVDEGMALSTGSFGPPDMPVLNNSGQPTESGAALGVTATANADGSVRVDLGSCTLHNFVVKRGECFAGPGAAGQPTVPAGGTVTFQPPPITAGGQCA